MTRKEKIEEAVETLKTWNAPKGNHIRIALSFKEVPDERFATDVANQLRVFYQEQGHTLGNVYFQRPVERAVQPGKWLHPIWIN